MKIMIVDDEVIIRTGLAQVINWEEIGLQLLEPAASAEEALERIPVERPNILLTDIRMTGKTGLQLAEEAKQFLPDLEVIILSGYDDFVYTQQAIRQNVSDYLLKTSRPEEIIRTVMQAKQRIEAKWEEHNQDFHKNKEARNRLFERLVMEGTVSETDKQLIASVLPHVFEETSSDSSFQVVMVAADGWQDSDACESLLLFAVENMLSELIECETLLQKKRIVALIRRDRNSEGRIPSQGNLAKIEQMLKCRLTAAFGKKVNKPEQLPESYSAAEYAFAYLGLLDDSVVEFSGLQQRKGGKSLCTQEEEQELSKILLQHDPVALKKWVQTYMQERLSDPQMTMESLQASLRSAEVSAVRWLQRVLAMTGRDAALQEYKGLIEAKSSEAPKEALFRYLYAIMTLYHNQLAEGQMTHVQKAMAYIEEHLEDDTGLQQVAKQVHLSPSHLSEVFKKETGVTFGDYVVRQKVARAKELLASSPAKVSEVAAKLGYEDVKYFGQLFKKYTGKTPSEFRGEAALAGNGRYE